jgi:hypothetical protein
MNELRVLAANGLMHGNGFPTDSLERGLDADPHFVGIDAGSTDGGPYYLGSGENMHQSREAAKEVLRTLITQTAEAEVPLLIGSAGTAGARIHVEWTLTVVREILDEEALDRSVAAIYSDQSADYLRDCLHADRVEPLGRSEPLTPDTIAATERIVGVMGPEPFNVALDGGADIVIAGRSSDVSIFKAIPIHHGFDEGLATHLAKTVECGGQITIPSTGGDVILGTLTDDAFRVTPTNPDKHIDPLTVSSHMLYESADPFRFVEPRGTLFTTNCTYEAIDDRTVEVQRSRFEPADTYTVKLEGVRHVGHRAVSMMGVRDPTLVDSGLDALLESVEEAVSSKAADRGLDSPDYTFTATVYGRDGVMGSTEPTPEPGHEVGILVDVVAPSPDTARGLTHEASNHLLHSEFPGRKCTAGNVAFPVSPQDITATEVYEFSVWHRTQVDSPVNPFTVVHNVLAEGGDR